MVNEKSSAVGVNIQEKATMIWNVADVLRGPFKPHEYGLVIYGRMIEVYLTVSVGPIPFATMANREWGQTGQNYLKSLLALGFQAFLIMVCVGIYAVLVQNIAVGDDITVAIWECLGYTVLLCYTLFRTGSLAKSLFGAH